MAHLTEVTGTLRMQPSTIGARTFILTHDEVACQRIELSPALAKVLNVLRFMRLIVRGLLFGILQRHFRTIYAFGGLRWYGTEEDLLGIF